jgi:hypothetical protein
MQITSWRFATPDQTVDPVKNPALAAIPACVLGAPVIFQRLLHMAFDVVNAEWFPFRIIE